MLNKKCFFLHDYNTVTYSEIANSELNGVQAVKIYYLIYGRNAWRNTWITRYYSEASMHLNYNSARRYAEEHRKRGSHFTIRELPAIAFQSSQGVFVVTQINENEPLKDYLFPDVNYHYIITDKCYRVLCPGQLIKNIADSFYYFSPFWKTQPESKDSVMHLATVLETFLEPYDGKLKQWESFSQGTDYYLGWDEVDNKICPDYILTIVNGLQSLFEKLPKCFGDSKRTEKISWSDYINCNKNFYFAPNIFLYSGGIIIQKKISYYLEHKNKHFHTLFPYYKDLNLQWICFKYVKQQVLRSNTTIDNLYSCLHFVRQYFNQGIALSDFKKIKDGKFNEVAESYVTSF